MSPGHVLLELLPILAFSSLEVMNLTEQIKVKRSSKCDQTSKQVACTLTAGYGHVKANHIQSHKDLNSNERKQISVNHELRNWAQVTLRLTEKGVASSHFLNQNVLLGPRQPTGLSR